MSTLRFKLFRFRSIKQPFVTKDPLEKTNGKFNQYVYLQNEDCMMIFEHFPGIQNQHEIRNNEAGCYRTFGNKYVSEEKDSALNDCAQNVSRVKKYGANRVGGRLHDNA